MNYRLVFLQVIRCLKLVVKATKAGALGLDHCCMGTRVGCATFYNHMQGKMVSRASMQAYKVCLGVTKCSHLCFGPRAMLVNDEIGEREPGR